MSKRKKRAGARLGRPKTLRSTNYTLSLHDALPILVLWLKLVKDFLKVRCRLALLPFLISCLIWLDLVASPTKSSNLSDRKSGSAGMPRPISYAVFCLKKKTGAARGYVPGTDRAAGGTGEGAGG